MILFSLVSHNPLFLNFWNLEDNVSFEEFWKTQQNTLETGTGSQNIWHQFQDLNLGCFTWSRNRDPCPLMCKEIIELTKLVFSCKLACPNELQIDLMNCSLLELTFISANQNNYKNSGRWIVSFHAHFPGNIPGKLCLPCSS